MSTPLPPNPDPDKPLIYEIKVAGHLGQQWTDWFEGLTITPEINGATLITGPVVDQAALHKVLKKVRDLGMTLLSVNCTEPDLAQVAELDEKARQRDLDGNVADNFP
jgi:hypothetical protein